MDSRKATRLKTECIEVILIDDNTHFPAILLDVSDSGMSVKCAHVFPTFKEIGILLHFEKHKLEMRGGVRWVNEHVGRYKDKMKEIGISIPHPPADYLDFVKENVDSGE
jgi:hypothetical protein